MKVLSENLNSLEKVIGIGSDPGFKAGMLDEEWLPVVGRNGWIVVSADTRIWRRSVLREVLFRAGVRAFFFTENNTRGETKAEILRKALPEMRVLVRDHAPPFVASLTAEGHAHLIFDKGRHKRVLQKQEAAHKRKGKLRKGKRKKH